ncbi:hypothetical protein S40285_03797 [Stachybotrys chlorohalonatus IBT 40285]|uniref:Uncharacterized protein n=1 Tax=Stachybotrys chlorohalonatus (strain IBT 40285) TaxID=1283841 RepID=A0A084QFS6_STAC4|nr:hypothetical protein S40285_03797 [Stachybotrys chlorohalonata IBT 40285]
MDSMKGLNTSLPHASDRLAQHESPEQLLDVFKAAALSVTKLYKTSARLESQARADGYQDCLDELLAFLDKENIGLNDGEGWRIRQWATEKLDGRESGGPVGESEDEVEKIETQSSPDITREASTPQPTAPPRTDSAPPSSAPVTDAPPTFVVPAQETFTFQSSHPYPNIATLDLSDTRAHNGASISSTRTAKSRMHGNTGKTASRSSGRVGSKRKMDFDDLFGGCFDGKDPFGNGPKRNRHA